MRYIQTAPGASAASNEATIARPRGQLVLWSDIVANRPSTHPGFVSTRVFGVPEVVENILENLEFEDLIHIQSTCAIIDTAIRTAPSLKSNMWQQKQGGAVDEVHWSYRRKTDTLRSHKNSPGAKSKAAPMNTDSWKKTAMLVHAMNPIFLDLSHYDVDSWDSTDIRRDFVSRLQNGSRHGLHAILREEFQSVSEMEKITKTPSAREMQLTWPPVKRVIIRVNMNFDLSTEEVKTERGVTIGAVFDTALRLMNGYPTGPGGRMLRTIQFPDGYVTGEFWLRKVAHARGRFG